MSANGNKFSRQSNQLRHKNSGGNNNPTAESGTTIDEQLTRLEEDIRRLKVEYDIYLNSGARRPPYDTKSRVETTIKRLADDRRFTFAQRYRYNSLVARYTSMRDLWRRVMQEREEGRDAATLARANRETAKEKVTLKTETASFVCRDATSEVETVRELYSAVVEAKKRCGEVTDDFTFPRFHRLVAAKTEALRQQLSCEQVRYLVAIENGNVVFKAKAEKQVS